MGDVYLAEDTRLDRRIALKLLPAEVADSQDRMRRFVQEAKAAAALNHPNIAHIYEIGESEGTNFIAMEFIEGEPLDVRLSGRPLANPELLDIATQIADALDEAHAKGITHRDVKPSNIMITSRGRVKVLDFGLAKVTAPAPGGGVAAGSELATRVKTSPGVVMGTVNYMSPEQALGRDVDHGSDIFSFGVVLYQMATGRLPFTADTATETIDRIAHSQPEAIARFNYAVSPALELIIKKTLRKDRDERYQATHELLVDLRDLRRELEISNEGERSVAPNQSSIHSSATLFSPPTTVSERTATGSVSSPPTTSSAEYLVGEIKRHKLSATVAAVTLLLLVAAAAIVLYRIAVNRRQTIVTAPTKVVAPANMKITRLTSNGKASQAAISPDGKWVVYELKDGGKQSLWIRQIATSSNIQIVPPAEVQFFRETFSPDGNYVYYHVTDRDNPAGALYQVSSLGGPARKILSNIASPITFSPDGNRIAFFRSDVAGSGEDQLMVANVDGTGERKLAARKTDSFFDYGGPDWSPDGKMIACSAGSYKGGYHLFVMVVDAETGTQTEFSKQRFSNTGRVSWLSDGSGMMVNASDVDTSFSQLWMVSYPGGEGRRITSDLTDYSGTSLTTDSKALVSVQYDGTANIWVAPVGDLEHGRQITNGRHEGVAGITWTPDNRIVYTTNTTGTSDIYIMNADGSDQRPITTDPHEDWSPAVSPDGRFVVFTSWRGGFPSLWRMDLDGSHLKQLTDGQEDYAPKISPDGQWIFFSSWRSGRQTLWKIPVDGGAPPSQFIDKFTTKATFSPDGNMLPASIALNSLTLPGNFWSYRPQGVNRSRHLMFRQRSCWTSVRVGLRQQCSAVCRFTRRAQNLWSQSFAVALPNG
jgi:serine/threonine protein kinase